MFNSTIPPILTKQTFVSHHKPLNIKKTQHITLEIKVLPGDRYTNVTGLKQLSGFQPSPLDNWISNGNIDINIETNFMRLLNHIFISFFFLLKVNEAFQTRIYPLVGKLYLYAEK
jgi:hypothetical protein